MPAKKSTNLAVVEVRLDSQDKALEALKHAQELSAANSRGDMKEVLAEITKINLSVAVLPKWDDIKKLHEETNTRLASLEETRSQQKGGWKVLAAVGSVCATVGGFLSSWISSLFDKTP